MERELTDRENTQIMSFGALHYSPRQMADNLDDFTEEQVIREMKTPGSPFARAYEKGKNRAQYLIDMKFMKMAQDGDLEALKIYERRLRENDAAQPPTSDLF